VLARWSGWGSLPQLFDDSDDRYANHRERARRLLGDDAAWAEARRTTLNAHYTSAQVVQAMWQAVQRLGFEVGRVLEPGCGSGNFIGFAPPGCELVGVEADRTTATVARHLYGPRADIHASRFETFDAPGGAFDLAIGNVPFAKVTPHDPHHNRGRHALHNYFIVKSLRLVRPGGLVAVLSSRYTLDSRNPAARREMASLADLVGAARLPAGAFKDAAGTDVVCDLLILRRRGESEQPRGAPWTRTVEVDVPGDGEAMFVNEYLDARPNLVLGTLTASRGMYRERELTVEPAGPLDAALRAALNRIVADAHEVGLTHTPRVPGGAAPVPITSLGPAVAAQEGSFVVTASGFARMHGGLARPYQPRYRRDEAELRRLITLRDTARAALAVQVDGGTDEDLRAAQRQLGEQYESYRRLYGSLNRYRQERTGRTDPETGEEIMRRTRPRMGGFRDDPDWPLVAALEVFDDETQQARPAAIFTDRVVSPPAERLGVDSAADALAASLDETGRVDLDRIAELLGTDTDAARRDLGELVYDDPATSETQPASRYLSANVRQKLEVARAAAAREPRWERNVAALEQVLPPQLEPSEITAGLGAPWIPASDVEAFCREMLGAEVEIERLSALGHWTVALRAGRRASVSLSSEWGTARADAISLLDAGLNQRLYTVTDETENGRRVRNDAETIAARDKQDAIAARFAAWVWEDLDRAERLAGRYNEIFASTVVPAHDGSHLTLPGIAETFRPHPHQRDAVARIVTDGRALLAHAVGAGKTATMVMAAMELRRVGSVSKPAVVVPNHMLEQFTREWLQLYPTAKVLVADKHRLSRERRKEFVARCATGDWDGIIFTQSGFARLPLGGNLLAGYLGEELECARQALTETREGKGLSIKRLERRIAQLEQTYQRLLATHTKDDGIRFEETGVDYLFVDESHLFKNRRVDSAINGMSHPGSQRAQDLDAKLWALRRQHGPRVVTFATATPVANSIAELWTMQTYLQPDVLAAADLAPFDSWAATFGRTVTALELAPDGASYRMHTRFARFQNVPELLTLYRQVADVRTTDDLDLPVPALAGGGSETVVVPASDRLSTYVAELAARAERVRSRAVDPSEDNMLKITGDGRRAPLDLRLVGEQTDPDGGKLRAAADRIAAIYHETRSNRYLDALGEPDARPGALQLVFCDASTPSGRGWNAYDQLRTLLVERGLPRDTVRFIHEATSDEAKDKLFAACRDGRVAVLIGSTDKMGVGTNVQARAIALHHLDCPWRPADIEQRDGRILRQGNQNPEVRVIRYATEGSFDIYMWQTVERKATFINQVATGRAVDRDVDDVGDQALSYAEVKALATGNPLILEKAAVDAEFAKLARLERAHHDDQHRLRRTIEAADRRTKALRQRIDQLEAAIAARTDTRAQRFSMTINGTRHTKRADAGAQLVRESATVLASTPAGAVVRRQIGDLADLRIDLEVDRRISDEIAFEIRQAKLKVRLPAQEVSHVDPAAFVSRLERRIQGLDSNLDDTRAELDAAGRELDQARARLGLDFDDRARLDELRRRQAEINEALIPTAEAGPDHFPEGETPQPARMAERLNALSDTTGVPAPSR
jgi:N12 class adenine-specific DNA methylase